MLKIEMVINDEDDFQSKIMRELIYMHYINSNQKIKWFPKVNYIDKKRTISELDLIIMEKKDKTVIGYEFKFLKYKKPNSNYQQIYSGLRQIQLYFWHGIEKGILCIGISKRVNEIINRKIKQITSTIHNMCSLSNMYHLGLLVYWEKEDKFTPFLLPQTKFPVDKIPLIKDDNEKILSGNLSWDKKWLHNHGLPNYVQGIHYKEILLKVNLVR